jgi:truncated hemoglobin YjbI
MKGIVQEFYHQHNKYRHYSMTIKMKEKRRWIDALLTAMFSWSPLQEQSQPLAEIAR